MLTVQRKIPQAVGLLIVAVITFLFYRSTDEVNNQIVFVTPYVVTLLVLTFASQRLRPPAAEGRPWFKGQSE